MAKVEWYSSWRVRDSLPVQKVPEKERWRLGLLNSLLGMQTEKYLMVQHSKRICAMIDSLCNTSSSSIGSSTRARGWLLNYQKKSGADVSLRLFFFFFFSTSRRAPCRRLAEPQSHSFGVLSKARPP